MEDRGPGSEGQTTPPPTGPARIAARRTRSNRCSAGTSRTDDWRRRPSCSRRKSRWRLPRRCCKVVSRLAHFFSACGALPPARRRLAGQHPPAALGFLVHHLELAFLDRRQQHDVLPDLLPRGGRTAQPLADEVRQFGTLVLADSLIRGTPAIWSRDCTRKYVSSARLSRSGSAESSPDVRPT